MWIGVDAHALGRRLTGNEVYVRSLLHAMVAASSTDEFVAYASHAAPDALPPRVRVRHVSGNPFRRLGWDLPARVRQDRLDVLHVQYTAPLVCPAPVVLTIHDVSFIEHPEYFRPLRRLQLRQTVGKSACRAARILTGSSHARSSILRAYPGLNPSNVRVIPYAASAAFRPLDREAAMAATRTRFDIAGPFILTVGDLHPRKNHIRLIRAFEELARAYPQIPHRLVIAGKDTWYADEVRGAARRSPAAGRIQFCGFVTDDDLVQLYNASDVFVFPSVYEGFGLPPLEAMACGRAVACSDATSLPEVVDSAAILFDPHQTREIVRALADLLLDAELRSRMERLALQRASRFSWNRTASQTLDVIHELHVEQRSRGRAIARP